MPVDSPVPRTRCRARLASFFAAAVFRPTIGPICSNGTAKPSCSTKATRSAGPSRSSTTSIARPTSSTSSASASGPSTASSTTTASVRRPRSTSRQIRDTTVVSHPGRFSSSAASTRSSRNQASCTASSASAVDPSMRRATAPSRPRSASNRTASSSRPSIGHLSVRALVTGLTMPAPRR